MAFAFSENRTKVTLLDPAQVENAIVTQRLRFLAAVIDGKGRQVSRRIGQEEIISRLGSPTRPPEQARAVPVAKDLHDGPVAKQLLEWIAELENRRPHK